MKFLNQITKRTKVFIPLFLTLAFVAGNSFAINGVLRPVKNIMWQDLMPAGHDLYDLQERILWQYDVDSIIDGSPEALELEAALKLINDNAPVVDTLDNVRIRMPGYVTALNFEERAMSEFLLVPYFGACIHTPPPPSNQIIYVTTTKPINMDEPERAIWVTGTLSIEDTTSELGSSGYRLQLDGWEYYQD